MVPPARLASTGALFGTDWLFDTQAQCMAATGDFDGALAVAENDLVPNLVHLPLVRIKRTRHLPRPIGHRT